jgi:hypothetical protein
MPRYLIEVFEPQAVASKRISRSVNTLGSHFATHADWHHQDGVSTGTMIVEAANHSGAFAVVPPAMRPDARVFSLDLGEAAALPYAPVISAAQPQALAA